MSIFRLHNEIQNYAWGSRTAMPGLLGYENPGSEPMAELWMGAHPRAPSVITLNNGNEIKLNEFINEAPGRVLGKDTAHAFGGRLPFLFKVLAAGAPLSIQAHPNLEQAQEGFARENKAGIALDAFNRNYKDDNHKPEIICALTEYHAMRGFRSPGVIASNFEKILIPELEPHVTALKTDSGRESLKSFFTELMQLPERPKNKLIDQALEKAGKDIHKGSKWIRKFAELYPGDIGIVSPLYLNVITLRPGEAMFLPAGELHAYLEGLGMELMANSDNVLRGGLTPKYVDVPELLSTLTFSIVKPEIISPVLISESESAYMTGASEFFLSRIELNGTYELPDTAYGPELPSIFICIEGKFMLEDSSVEGGSLDLDRGETAFATFGSSLRLHGRALVYRASIPSRRRKSG